MKSILFFQYAATGEGWRTIVRFDNQSTITDEDEVAKLKEELHEYFHVGIELHDVSTAKDNESLMRDLKEHVPSLYDYLMIPDDGYRPAIRIKYEGYINYA